MKNSEIVQMTDLELEHQLEVLQKERLNLKIQARIGQLKNSARLQAIRRDIARIKTELRKRAVAGNSSKKDVAAIANDKRKQK